jgi:hypothetical protein
MAANITKSSLSATVISMNQSPSASAEEIDDEMIAARCSVGESLYDKIKHKRRRCTTSATTTETTTISSRSTRSSAAWSYKEERSTNECKARVVAKAKVVYKVEEAGPSTRKTPSQKKKNLKKKKSTSATASPRRSSRGNSSLSKLATAIADNQNIIFITGAGLSVNSGIQPFRGDNGVWNEVLWT